jgi:hypothetical protein
MEPESRRATRVQLTHLPKTSQKILYVADILKDPYTRLELTAKPLNSELQ